MKEYPLNIKAEIEYARRWAFSANPAYYNFENIGGDCTNFVSQCLYAGGAVMTIPVTQAGIIIHFTTGRLRGQVWSISINSL